VLNRVRLNVTPLTSSPPSAGNCGTDISIKRRAWYFLGWCPVWDQQGYGGRLSSDHKVRQNGRCRRVHVQDRQAGRQDDNSAHCSRSAESQHFIRNQKHGMLVPNVVITLSATSAARFLNRSHLKVRLGFRDPTWKWGYVVTEFIKHCSMPSSAGSGGAQAGLHLGNLWCR